MATTTKSASAYAEVSVVKVRSRSSRRQVRGELRVVDRAPALSQLLDASGVDVDADDRVALGQDRRHGESDIAQSDDDDSLHGRRL